MENKPGIFIALEGTNGSGKSTQFKLIADRLKKNGYDVETFRFPQYGDQSSYFIREYLAGNLGKPEDIGPYTASMFFALDRFHSAEKIREALEKGKVVLADRFTGSNMAHQGVLFDNVEQRRGFFIWLDQIEYEMFKIPRPHISLVLRVPADIASKNVTKRGEEKDIHEKDMEHLKKSVEVYDNLCQLFPKDFKEIDCVRSGKILDPQTINDQIWETMLAYLPDGEKLKKKIKNDEKTDSSYLKEENGALRITEEGRQLLEPYLSDTKGDVYAFTDKLPPQTIAAAMARLSRRGDDMRITILDEFAETPDDQSDKLLKRVITAYGDDSVQQLVGQHVVVENASNLLTKKLEWGRLAAYLEQSTRYIYFDKKDKDGNYRYHKLNYLNQDVQKAYDETMDKIFDIYSYMVARLTDYVRSSSSAPEKERDGAWKAATRAQACDAARTVLPVATKSTVGIFASGQALESLIMHLLSDNLAESHEVGRKLLSAARKTIPAFLERVDINERGVLAMGYKAFTRESTRQMADELLPARISGDTETVRLVDVWPKNEMEIIPDILYEHSPLSLVEIRKEMENWSIKKKKKVIDSYIGDRFNRRHKPGRAFEKIHYSWDILCDYGIFRDLQRHRMVDDLAWQALTPRYGYEVPGLVQDAGLSEEFEKCFDLSLKLYSLMQEKGYEQEAQYATLLGHRMRWKVTFNAREAYHIIELRSSPQGHPSYRKIVRQMYEKIGEIHPLVAAGMKFVNQKDDPELTRLAAERYTQKKLAQLDK
ncbi:MAG TPA: FAD-dependent thymidylate synthase [Candidatus Saccharimonadales bacterium]|nr:FAD-dependent thymidylate synthase [Candidatus Saccharimonadales bacterium]